jgi:hypothetical protein
MAGGEKLARAVEALDENGWSKEGVFHPNSNVRACGMLSPVLTETLELYLGDAGDCTVGRIKCVSSPFLSYPSYSNRYNNSLESTILTFSQPPHDLHNPHLLLLAVLPAIQTLRPLLSSLPRHHLLPTSLSPPQNPRNASPPRASSPQTRHLERTVYG